MPNSTAVNTRQASETVFAVILAVSFGHFLNDLMQSMLASIYPLLKDGYSLAFWQIGLLTLTFQGTASVLQPLIGTFTDRSPKPYSLPVGMLSTFVGLLVLASAPSYPLLVLGAALIGLGSSIFHPEASRVARLAAGRRFSTAQATFQVGGNIGTAIGPLLAAFIVVPRGQASVAWFSAASFVGMLVLGRVSAWYSNLQRINARQPATTQAAWLPRRKIAATLAVLASLVFAKYTYIASFTSYYTFYTIHRFGVSIQGAQFLLFLFLGSLALGTVVGGPIGDRIGARKVIWLSIAGVLPFSLALPYANLFFTALLTVPIGMILASAFPAIIVFGQELLPGRVGMVAGTFFGFAFGMGGIAAAALGVLADWKGIVFVYQACSFLPFLGLLAVFLPKQSAIDG